MNEDVVIYWHPDGVHYIGVWAECCWAWPAESGGWARRRKAREDEAELSDELEPHNARLAILASGVPVEDVS